MSAIICSEKSFERPYGLIGACGQLSRIGISSAPGSPYVAQGLEKISRPTPDSAIASSSASVPPALFR